MPLLIGVGPIRSGTTWTHALLFSHSQISTTVSKEVRYFDQHFDRGEVWYTSQFKPISQRTRLFADVTPYYILSPQSLERIKATIVNPLIVVNLRSPYERALSWWTSFGRAEFTQGTRVGADPMVHAKMLRVTLMAPALEQCFNLFGRARVSFIDYDELRRDPRAIARDLQQRFGLKVEMPASVDIKVHASVGYRSRRLKRVVQAITPIVRKISPDVYHAMKYGLLHGVVFQDRQLHEPSEDEANAVFDALRDHFERDIDRQEDLLQRDLSRWRHPLNGGPVIALNGRPVIA
jgi:hypothetical protein